MTILLTSKVRKKPFIAEEVTGEKFEVNPQFFHVVVIVYDHTYDYGVKVSISSAHTLFSILTLTGREDLLCMYMNN